MAMHSLIHEVIRIQSFQSPDRAAVVCGDSQISYGELERKYNVLAALLQTRKIGPGQRVGIFLEPGCERIVALLGILKSGAAYVPLSTTYPIARVFSILNSSQSSLVVCSGNTQNRISGGGIETLALSSGLLSGEGRISDLQPQNDPEASAYVLFTSGSTGIPKGVNILHRNLSYYTRWSAGFFKETVGNRLPLTASINFAAAVSQIYSCLASGETLHVLPDYLGEPSKLFKWYAEHPDYGLYCVPSVWNMALEWLANNSMPSNRRPSALFLSGENISAKLIADTFDRFPGMAVWNLYGPTEAVANVSVKQITHAAEVSIGSPLPGTAFYVVTESGSEAKINEEGKLYAFGPGISPGYVGDARLTESVFFHYFSARDGLVPVHDTGDYVRRVSDRDYKFMGRKDQQIKLHGQRIELAEIENRLLNHPGISNAVVSVIQDDRPTVVAYIQTRSGKAVAIGELRKYLLLFLTEMMVPDRWVFVDSFPKLANGKIDRKNLPAPTDQRPELGYEFLAASEAREKKMVAAFEKSLGIQGVGVHDNFFDLGGNSLKLLKLLIEIEDLFAFRPNFRNLFEFPTPLALLRQTPVSGQTNTRPALPSLPDNGKIPLTAAQQGLLFFQKAYPDNTAYSIAYSIGIDGPLDVKKLEQAIVQVALRHLPLSSELRREGDSAYFSSDKKPETALSVECLDSVQEDRREAMVRESVGALAARPFDLYGKPLYRYKLYRLSARRHVLAWIVSHFVFDGISAGIFLKELASLYQGELLPSHENSFLDVVQRRRVYQTSQQHDLDRAFWAEYLSGVASLTVFPKLYKTPEVPLFKGGRVSSVIDRELRDCLTRSCKENGGTLNMLLLAAFAVALHKFGEQEEFVIATPFSNRLAKFESNLIGYFVNTVFYRVRFNHGIRFSDLVDAVRTDTIGILDHQQMPFHELANILREQGVKIPISGFRAMFSCNEISEWKVDAAGIQMTAREVFAQYAKCDLHLECFDDSQSIALEFTYAKETLDAQTADQIVSTVTQVLKKIVTCYDGGIATLTDILPVEREEVLRHSVGQKLSYGEGGTLYSLFLKSCADFGNLPSISFEDRSVSYSELRNQVAVCMHGLAGLSLEDREPLGIYMDSTPEMVVAILAASALAHPYVPLDPAYPEERTRHIINHAGIRNVLTTSALGKWGLEKHTMPVFVDELIERPQDNALACFDRATPEDLLYIIYTSGSTGIPKGVMVPHKGVVNYLLWMKSRFGSGEDTRILAKTSISFDISVWELFLPLISGGVLVMDTRANIESPEQLARVIRKKKVNVIQFVPSGLKLFCEAEMLAQTPTLKKIFCGGEKLAVNLQDDVLSRYGGELYNLYGPTEASIFMSCNHCSSVPQYENVPIGRPIQNSSLYVLDNNLKLLPRNVPGQLYIGGDVLAQGYWKDAEQTAKFFIPGPPELPETTLYSTGDRGRMLSDGSIEFLGRIDHQVKILGYRVELQEIEKAIERFPGIRQAVVFKSTQGEDDARLIAVAVPADGVAVDINAVRARLRSMLPPYMIPASVTLVNNIPLLPNGKIDLKAIGKTVALNAAGAPYGGADINAGKVEKTLFRAWREVLEDQDFTLTDNFFEVGGNSLLFLSVREKIKTLMNIDFSIVELYQYPTISGLSELYWKKKGLPRRAESISLITKRMAKIKGRFNAEKE